MERNMKKIQKLAEFNWINSVSHFNPLLVRYSRESDFWRVSMSCHSLRGTLNPFVSWQEVALQHHAASTGRRGWRLKHNWVWSKLCFLLKIFEIPQNICKDNIHENSNNIFWVWASGTGLSVLRKVSHLTLTKPHDIVWFPHYVWENWDPERPRNSPKVTHLVACDKNSTLVWQLTP